MLETSFPQRGSNSFNLCQYIRGLGQGAAKYGGTVRFGLKCIIMLAILYRAILLSLGGSGAAALSSQVADAVPAAETRMRDEIAHRLETYCTRDPEACLDKAAGLTSLVAPATPALTDSRPVRHRAVAAAVH
jgi:hypothetical protein